jgi:hypothetical protein
MHRVQKSWNKRQIDLVGSNHSACSISSERLYTLAGLELGACCTVRILPMGGIVLQIWVFSVGLAGSVPPPPPCRKGTDREGCTGKDDCRNDLDPADQTCLNCVFDLLKPVLGLSPGNWISPKRLTGINRALVNPVDTQLEAF